MILNERLGSCELISTICFCKWSNGKDFCSVIERICKAKVCKFVAIHKSWHTYKLSYRGFSQSTYFSCHIKCFFVILRAKPEVSIKLGCVLNSMDISPTAQYDNIEFLLRLAIRLVANAQNDKGLFVILSFRKKAKYPLAKPHLWLFRKSQSLHYLLEIVLFYALIHQKQIHKPPNAKGKPAQQKLNYAKPYVAFVKPIYAKHT